ncbi:histidine phosphatase family protein [Anaeromicropila herbilytica]|uniref:Phosphoglycerate mutase n=1 Tax=Anaeromicropila herbilytica TaxID=2785025 RepID=A0A7R7IDP6_9FIRM|nr:histidine phosphatase family protein [Anaeromicropila herbilytica]BCN31762.1 phosphoglycerate mutase [Anaeromicropila herbilytica]
MREDKNKKIYLIRHARQSSALCNVNVDLSEIGRKQADLLGQRVLEYEIDALYSSDLHRAVETAEIVNQYLHLHHEIREGIREINFGDLEGNSEDYNKEHFKEFKAERAKLESDIPFPNGECGKEVYDRAIKVMDEIKLSSANNILVVTHGGTIRSLLAGILGLDQSKKLLFALSLENCSITELGYNEKEDRFYLERFNDYSHLESHPECLRKNWN